MTTALLSLSLDVCCPNCGKVFDLFNTDSDDSIKISRALFNNDWSDLKGLECLCPLCHFDFTLDGVEY